MPPASDNQFSAEVTRSSRPPWFMFRGALGFEWTKIRAPIRHLPDELVGFRFMHLSDLHLRGYWSRAYDELIEGIAASPPDLLFVTGDFIDNKHDHRPGLRTLQRLLPKLKSRLGIYGILGNHDVDVIAPYLREMGVHLIDCRRALLESGNGARVELIGLPGLDRRDLDAHFIASQPAREAGTLRIVLSHFPDQFPKTRPLRADFFLAGHTHGGQICFPNGRAVITHDRSPWPYYKGIHRRDETWYIVSRGLGYSGVPVRLNCPAEVAEITVIGGGGREGRAL
jgi:predicted MPP superfamily phosphohydrolase